MKSTNEDKLIQVAVVGCGYWGPNLVRNLETCPTTQVAMICDQSQDRLDSVGKLCPKARQVRSFDEVIAERSVDAVVIATPVSTHASLGIAALNSGKHVLVEKPLAASIEDAEAIVEAAQRSGRTLMVDHTFVYSPAVRKIKKLIDSGELGDVFFVDGVRINLGLFQHDVNVVWDLAPHDISILEYWFGRLPKSVGAFGSCHANRNIEDVAHVTLDFGNDVLASLHVNWLSPVKVRNYIIGGSIKSVLYDDLEPAEKIKIYDRGITVDDDPEKQRGILIGYRTGDVSIPNLPTGEPLQTMVRHFSECILEEKPSVTDGNAGLRVVRILEAAERSIKAQGGRITL